MAAYQLRIEGGARRELSKLPSRVRDEALAIIEDLPENPFPLPLPEIRMDKYKNKYKIKFFEDSSRPEKPFPKYRIVYTVTPPSGKQPGTVRIERVRLRKTAYHSLRNP